MPEEVAEQTKVIEGQEQKIEKDPFDDNQWVAEPVQKQSVNEPAKVEKTEGEGEKIVVDADGMLVKETGWKTWAEAKAAREELDTLKKAPKTEPAKLNEASEKMLKALEGENGEEELYNYLQTKKQIQRAEKLDASKPKDAAEIIKLELKYKNPDLTDDEVDYLVDKRYSVPDKPEKEEDQTDEQYEKKVAKWEKEVKLAEKAMTIDAKLAKPGLSKFMPEIALPKIQKTETSTSKEPTQEELAVIQAARDSYVKAFDKDYVNFKGFNVEVLDEEVKIPVSYVVTDKEREATKESLTTFDLNEYFQNRWFDADKKTGVVTPKVEQAMRDKYILENFDKIIQKAANESAAQMKAHLKKQRLNTDLNNGSQKTNGQQSTKSNEEQQKDAIWEA